MNMRAARERRRRRVRIVALLLLVLIPASIIAGVLTSGRSGDPGALDEFLHQRPSDVPPVRLANATTDWGLDEVRLEGGDPLSGGAALADLDLDGDLDLLVANGSVFVLLWTGNRFGAPIDLEIDDAVSVVATDLDLDTWPDIIVARRGKQDQVIWGGPWLQAQQAPPETSNLDGGNPSSILLPGDLDADGRSELVRLGRGATTGTDDVIWTLEAESRTFSRTTLPDSNRLSLAGTLADLDNDGLLDIWITRDVGWDIGGDSLYSRQGKIAGDWADISADLGTALEIDGMGVTLADLDGDLDLDAYISDIGENEILGATPDGFRPLFATGAGRIRPPSQPRTVISSSWASGAADMNLDGQLDLVVVGGGFPNSNVRNKVAGTTVADSEPPAVFLGIGDGQFVDAWPETGLELKMVGRALTLGDIDQDGDTDVIMVGRNGDIEALRNETLGASLTVSVPERCGSGLELTVQSGGKSFMTIIPQFTYGGSHAAEVTVGVADGPASVLATRVGVSPDTYSVEIEQGRRFMTLEC